MTEARSQHRSVGEHHWRATTRIGPDIRLGNSTKNAARMKVITVMSQIQIPPKEMQNRLRRASNIDSGASIHMEISSLTASKNITERTSECTLGRQTADGFVEVFTKAPVHIKQLGTKLRVYLAEDSPSVLSLGRLCNEVEYSYSWPPSVRGLCIARRQYSSSCVSAVVLILGGSPTSWKLMSSTENR